MKARRLEHEVTLDIDAEKQNCVREILKEKKREIEKTRTILKKLERQYQDLLDTDIDEIYYDWCW